MRCLALPIVVLTLLGSGGHPLRSDARAGQGQEPQPSLEEAYRIWHKGFASGVKEEREKTLRSMLPDQKDVEYLLPKHAAKLWPKFEEAFKEMMMHVDEIAAEVTRHGEIQKIEVTDVRKDKMLANGSYKDILAIIPPDVTLCDLHVIGAKGSGGSGTYVYVNKHWRFIKDFDTLPPFLEKLK
jgi:hypothetical protein